MALTVNTNTASNNAINNLNRTSRSLSRSFERISSGLRIAKAADDAAGLGVAENLDQTERAARQAMRNTNDGISLIQTAEGAASEVSSILKRMKELAVQSSSETLQTTERGYIQDEFEALSAEVERIAQVTEFGGLLLAEGTNTALDVQVGVGATTNDRITLVLGDLRATILGVDTATMDMSTVTNSQTALGGLDTALDSVNQYRSTFGSTQNRLDSALNNLEIYTENLASAESRIRDADFAFETAEMAKYQVMQQAGTSVLAQANQINQSVLSLLNG
jgi:flagellin